MPATIAGQRPLRRRERFGSVVKQINVTRNPGAGGQRVERDAPGHIAFAGLDPLPGD